MYCTLPHLNRAETEKYIRSYMEFSESPQEIFTEKAIDEIYKIKYVVDHEMLRLNRT